MNDRNFLQMLKAQWFRGNFVCVGLDSDFYKIPDSVKQWNQGRRGINVANTIVVFNKAIVEATNNIVCAYKLNTAFYEMHGEDGFNALRRTIADIHTIAPDVLVILDAKRGDIGNTNEGYVKMAFDYLKADAITVHPYLGEKSLRPFFVRAEKGVIVLCRTSNPGAGEFQDLSVNGEPLYRFVARRVANNWNKYGNCALVVGATCPDELGEVRRVVGNMPILIPGIGAQSGDVEKVVSAGQDSQGQGMIINSSRIILASKSADFAEVAHRETTQLNNSIHQCLF